MWRDCDMCIIVLLGSWEAGGGEGGGRGGLEGVMTGSTDPQ